MPDHESEPRFVALRSGAPIPIIGFGTWQIEGDPAYEAVSAALEIGYRHIDTATVYGNERKVGRALEASGLLRDELFITTKLPGNATAVRATLEQSLSDLAVDYVDLWLIHWPPARSYQHSPNSSLAMYEAMLELRDDGMTRAVGVSNYSIEEIDDLVRATGESPEVNQIPWSPFDHDAIIRAELDSRSICLEGYSPIALSRLDDPVLVGIATSHRVTPAQVVLRWHVQHGVVVLPKSVHRERIRENFDLAGFSLSPDELEQLDRSSLVAARSEASSRRKSVVDPDS